jgi:hypothetical protein
MAEWFVCRRDDGAIRSAHEVEKRDSGGKPINPMPDYLSGEVLDDAASAELRSFLGRP